MIALVTLAQAKEHLHKLDDYLDSDVELKIMQASAMVLGFLKKADVPDDWIVDSTSSPVTYDVPYIERAATLLMIGDLMENREAGSSTVMSESVTNLLKLSPYWDATIA